MIDLKSMVLPEMEEYFRSLDLPRFRSKQVFSWLHEKRAASFDEMTNLPLSLRQQLAEQCTLTTLVIERKLVSQLDGTIKYLYRLPDGNHIESVLMRYEHGNSLCISSQVGCKMGCAFCASTKAGFVRNLTPSEILEQVYMAGRDTGEKISNIVMMGIGEPLDNYENVLRFLELVSDPNGLNLSHRHISLSTCGVVDKIYDLADRDLQITLSISLHATTDSTRGEIMPINRRWGIKELLDACRYYTDKTHRRISYEYALIAGVNDSRKQAEELAALLKGMLCHINLIPVNYVREAGYEKSGKGQIYAFQKALNDRGMNATVRRTLGADINAACGQLRREAEEPGRE
ncbi:MAG TPA: 23S rRNA (adenine(2503)-C(2))-methyltransferase RlmN [Candidatus Merdivicinus intestinigallinarum]|nr:23S rRNA (adenine(2503)-C(2))-methyltransferase RlmN [Candidatus Merdivicinus intestinigallinarum]